MISDKSITFCCIPSHVGIRENKDDNIADNSGLGVAITKNRFPVSRGRERKKERIILAK